MWVPIHGWENLYELNEYGVVRNIKTKRLIVGDVNSVGYMRVSLYCKSHTPSKQRLFRHRLVAEHFIDNPLCLPEVNHIDNNKSNNYVKNLEWVTRTKNERHSHLYGNKLNRSYIVKYNDHTEEAFVSSTELADKIGVTRRTVINWLKGKFNGYSKYGISSIHYKDSV